MTIVLKIKELADEKKISYTELGERIGKTRQTVYDIFGGRQNLSIELLEKFAKALNVSVGYFFSETTIVDGNELLEIKNLLVLLKKNHCLDIGFFITLIYQKLNIEDEALISFCDEYLDKNDKKNFIKNFPKENLNIIIETDFNKENITDLTNEELLFIIRKHDGILYDSLQSEEKKKQLLRIKNKIKEKFQSILDDGNEIKLLKKHNLITENELREIYTGIMLFYSWYTEKLTNSHKKLIHSLPFANMIK